ncbi:Retrovirus-related Pol polyprotein from transposon RE1 [Vitis vinifera]|uniref:Retrovirus-related Pol polyprotein from transposon RE1 n=1 Tax=Vitis vinifera TaxID=29760 RepID=A0A438FC95_VITVI|nr:Retrovirus-related Pol polyprotein from transposon RE1 [Vitis vinifera]
MDLNTNKILVSRNVIFHETIFPFQVLPQHPETHSFMFPLSQSFSDSPSTTSFFNSYHNVGSASPPNNSPSLSEPPALLESNSPTFPSPSHLDSTDPEVLQLRKSTRIKQKPSYLQDYYCGNVSSSQNATQTSTSIDCSPIKEPKSYTQASRLPEWQAAMQHELTALEFNKTWELVTLPKNKRTIGWYTQQEGLDFFDTFSPVAKITSIHLLLVVAAVKQWHLHQLDVNNAFLHGDLHEEVYIELLPGLAVQGEQKVCRLLKSLYGLKQASRQWLKTFLDAKFTIKDLGPLKYFIGLEVARSKTGISLCQRKYILHILEDIGLTGSKHAAFPMESTLKLSANDTNFYEDPSGYRRLIGRLLYLTLTRPDLAYSVQVLSQFLAKPAVSHHQAVIRVLRYLKAKPGQVSTDSKSAMPIATNPVQHERTKHIQIDCHLIREKLQQHVIKLFHIPSRLQLANIFTKPHGSLPFHHNLRKMNIINIHVPLEGGCWSVASHIESMELKRKEERLKIESKLDEKS